MSEVGSEKPIPGTHPGDATLARRSRSYVVAVLAVLAAAFVRHELTPIWGSKLPFITFFPAVVLAAWFGGLGPGLLAMAVSTVCALLFLPPFGSLRVEDPGDLLGLAAFTAANLVILALNQALYRARQRAEGARDALRDSEERLRGIVTSATDAIITIDARQKITLFNTGAEAIFGYSASEMIGRTLDQLIPERFRTIHWHHVDAFGLTGISTRAMGGERVLAGLRRNGEEFPVEARISQVEIGGQKLYTVILRDITERKRAEAERAQLAAIVSSSADAIVGKTLDGIVTSWNQGAELLFGYTAEEMIGQPISRLLPSELPGDYPMILDAVRRGERIEHFETQRVRKDGQRIHVSLTVSPIRDSMGRIIGASKVARDVTDRIRADKEREELLAVAERAKAQAEAAMTAERVAREAAEAASRAKDAFLATVSHELRTPLSPILTWARMLGRDGATGKEVARGIEVIERCARSQAQLIEDLLDVSRIVAGKMRLEVRPVMVAPVIEKAVDIVRPAADAKGVRLQVVLDTEVGAVLGDSERLQQVVWNLLSNAIHFTPNGGRVQVALERVNSHIEITVSDSGQGIAQAFLPYVFERFRQADVRTSRAHGGLGLGLAIVRHIVEAHGGTVHAESPGVGQGSVFTVKLPLMMARTAGEVERRHPTAELAAGVRPLQRLDGLRILIVDDEPDSNEAVGNLLVSCGAEVRAAASAQDARDILGRWRADVLVSDVGLPGEDGYGLISSLRAKDDELAQIPAVALTAYASREDKVRLLSAGFQAHVPKPLDAAELVAVIASLGRPIGKTEWS